MGMKKSWTRIKKILEKNKEACIFGGIAGIVLVAILVMLKVDLENDILQYRSHISDRNEEQIVYNFTEGMEIRQEFQCYRDFDFITLSFSDHDKQLNGRIRIDIFECEKGETIYSQEMEMSSIHYNVPVEISFNDFGGGIAGQTYEIVLQSVESDGEAIGIFGYKVDNAGAMIDQQQSEYSLSIGMHSYTNVYEQLVITFFLFGITSIILVIVCIFKLKMKEDNLFWILAIPFIICMLIVWPGNGVYDETRHYHTVYHYSNVLLGVGENDHTMQVSMRKCDLMNENELDAISVPINAQAQQYGYYSDMIWENENDRSLSVVNISYAPYVNDGSFVQYTPGIVGMTLARLLRLNHYWMMTMTRVFIAAFYVLTCYYAIRKIPILKQMMIFMAALPMNLYQASGISYDSLTYAVGSVVFALIVKLWYEGLDKKHWIILGLFVFILGNCKGGVYLTLILLLWLIPKKCFNGKKWFKIAGVFVVAGSAMIISFLPTIKRWVRISTASVNGTIIPAEVINSGGVVATKLSPFFVVTNPIDFIEMFVKTLTENLDTYLGQMLGYRTAWSNETIQLVIVLPFLVFLILAVVKKEQEEWDIGIGGRVGIFVMLLIEFIGLQAIFLAETPSYSDIIIGFQGRYFILFLPCILLLFRNEGIIFKKNKEYLYPAFSMAQLIYLYFFLKMFMIA